jgi:hypothetical protein
MSLLRKALGLNPGAVGMVLFLRSFCSAVLNCRVYETYK